MQTKIKSSFEALLGEFVGNNMIVNSLEDTSVCNMLVKAVCLTTLP